MSPFVTKRRTLQMLYNLKEATLRGVKVNVVTRPSEDFTGKDMTAWQDSIKLMIEAGVRVIHKTRIHQKFAVADQKIVWYGSINLLSFGNAEESIMRIENIMIAHELVKSISEG